MASTKTKKDWYKKPWGMLVAILFWPFFVTWYAWAKSNWNKTTKIVVTVIIGILVLVSNSYNRNQPSVNTRSPTPTTTTTPTPLPTQEPVETPTPAPQIDNQNTSLISSETVSQKNAVKSAKSYLAYTAFSHGGLVAQLEYEQYSYADAVYGADNCGADWNEQAAKSAKQYMEYSAFSRGGLIDQLKYEKYTQEQAEYGADSVGL